MARDLGDGRVEHVKQKLRPEPDREHEKGYGNDDEFFAEKKIRKHAAAFGQWAAEKRLHCADESDGGEQEQPATKTKTRIHC